MLDTSYHLIKELARGESDNDALERDDIIAKFLHIAKSTANFNFVTDSDSNAVESQKNARNKLDWATDLNE